MAKIKNPAYMYRQGSGWIVCTWDNGYGCYTTSNEMPYFMARAIVGTANCTRKHCTCITHNH